MAPLNRVPLGREHGRVGLILKDLNPGVVMPLSGPNASVSKQPAHQTNVCPCRQERHRKRMAEPVWAHTGNTRSLADFSEGKAHAYGASLRIASGPEIVSARAKGQSRNRIARHIYQGNADAGLGLLRVKHQGSSTKFSGRSRMRRSRSYAPALVDNHRPIP